MNAKSVLADSFHFYTGNIVPIAKTCIPIFAAVYALQLAVAASIDSPYEKIFEVVAGYAAYPLYTAAAILAIAKRAKGEAVHFSSTLIAAGKLWWPLFLLMLSLMGLIFLGLILLIVPGIWLGVRLSFSEIFLVLSNTTHVEALKKSYGSTKPHFSSIFLTLALLAIPMWLISFGLSKLHDAVGNNYPVAFVLGVCGMVIGLFTNVVIFRMFMLSASSEEA